jgi:hypothetical protein
LAVASIAVTLLMPRAAVAQDVTGSALKAAFIYNFMKFTEWPEPIPASDPFVICVLGDPAVGDALGRVVKGREFAGRRMSVLVVEFSESLKACRVVYLSGMAPSRTALILAEVKDLSVLTISDMAGFTQAGGQGQLFFEGGQLRFTIGVAAVKRSRLQMSSRLLALSK